MLQRAITNGHRHGIELKVGTLNAAAGDCTYQAILANIQDRDCFGNKIYESADTCRAQRIALAQSEAHISPCIGTDIDVSREWAKLKGLVYMTQIWQT